jgi:hypothetical protein
MAKISKTSINFPSSFLYNSIFHSFYVLTVRACDILAEKENLCKSCFRVKLTAENQLQYHEQKQW